MSCSASTPATIQAHHGPAFLEHSCCEKEKEGGRCKKRDTLEKRVVECVVKIKHKRHSCPAQSDTTWRAILASDNLDLMVANLPSNA